MEPATIDRIQQLIDDEALARFAAGAVPRLALLRHGDHPVIEPGELYLQVILGQDGPGRLEGEYFDDPWVEPGDLLVRVIFEETEEDPPLPAWGREHDAACRELHRELAAKVPAARYLQFWFGGETGHQGRSLQRLHCPPDRTGRRERDLTPIDIGFASADLEMLDALITAGAATSRTEAIGWVLARIRERPAYAKLSERARELDELKARF